MKKGWLFLIILPLFLAGCIKAGDKQTTEQAKSLVDSFLTVEEPSKDLGTISMEDGNVSVNYKVTNQGQEPVVIKEMYTSCMCTTAQADIDGTKSRKVGMKGHGYIHDIYQIVEPGKTATVEAIYDPNAHGPQGIGVARRTVFLETNSKTTPTVKLNFEANVVRTSAELPPKTSIKSDPISYTDIKPAELKQILDAKDFFLVDVHIPEQNHIEQTDLFVPFDEISKQTDRLPQDKDTKIVLYCRSGSMSARAADDLINLGYTNVYNLTGGKNAYDEFVAS